jgi:endonuclease-3
MHKVLRKHYEPVAPPSDRPVLEHLLYACVLEHARHDAVDDVFARLQKSYFDWNEVRVTSVPELAEILESIPDAIEASKRLKRALQCVFETHYLFDIEFLRKQGLAKAVETIEKYNGVTPFAVAYVTQNALAGHSIPVNAYALALLVVLGAVNESDAAKNRVPGLERAIPKNKGVEFGSLLHQFAVDFAANPQSAHVKQIAGEIVPEARDRLPKKVVRPAPPSKPPVERRAALPPKPPLETKPPKMQALDKGESGKKPEKDRRSESKKPKPEPAAEAKSKTAAGARITRKKPK